MIHQLCLKFWRVSARRVSLTVLDSWRVRKLLKSGDLDATFEMRIDRPTAVGRHFAPRVTWPSLCDSYLVISPPSRLATRRFGVDVWPSPTCLCCSSNCATASAAHCSAPVSVWPRRSSSGMYSQFSFLSMSSTVSSSVTPTEAAARRRPDDLCPMVTSAG